jgi:ferredoxin
VSTVRIVVDHDKCIGSGNCVYWAPDSFDLDDEGQSVAADPPGDTVAKLRVAADGCPTRAIVIEIDADPDAASSDDHQGD